MEININEYIKIKDIENPFIDREETPEEKKRQKEFENKLKELEKEQKRKWNSWLSSNFPSDYEKRKQFAYMTIRQLADYFLKRQDEFEIWKDFIQERCDAEKFGGYLEFCTLIKTKRLAKKFI